MFAVYFIGTIHAVCAASISVSVNLGKSSLFFGDALFKEITIGIVMKQEFLLFIGNTSQLNSRAFAIHADFGKHRFARRISAILYKQ